MVRTILDPCASTAFRHSPLPPDATEHPAVHVSEAKGGHAALVEHYLVVFVGRGGAGERADLLELPEATRPLADEPDLDRGQ